MTSAAYQSRSFIPLGASVGVTLTLLLHASACRAGTTEVQAAQAIASTITYYEKCTGNGPSPAKMDRIVKSMLSAGMSPQDFATGSKQATTEIERLYPGRTRPPQKVCKEAVSLYNDAFGNM